MVLACCLAQSFSFQEDTEEDGHSTGRGQGALGVPIQYNMRWPCLIKITEKKNILFIIIVEGQAPMEGM